LLFNLLLEIGKAEACGRIAPFTTILLLFKMKNVQFYFKKLFLHILYLIWPSKHRELKDDKDFSKWTVSRSVKIYEYFSSKP